MTLLIGTSGKNGITLWLECHSGNASDQKTLEEAAQRIQKFTQQLKNAPPIYFVADSAMYLNCGTKGDNLLWLSRVPEKINLAKDLLSKDNIEWETIDDHYKMYVTQTIYNNVKQKWVLIFSQDAYDKEIITLEKNIQKEYKELVKAVKHISNQDFGCEVDVEKSLKMLSKKLQFHKITFQMNQKTQNTRKSRPSKEENNIKYI